MMFGECMLKNLKARIKKMADEVKQVLTGETPKLNDDELETEIRELEEKINFLKSLLPSAEERHTHEWKKGVLPGQVEIRTCSICGKFEKV
jgi:hypothetical protein